MLIRDLIIELLQYDLNKEIYVDGSKIDRDSNIDTLDIIDIYEDILDEVYIKIDR